MKIIYLDQNLIVNIAKPPKDQVRQADLAAFLDIAHELVRTHVAVFPYSDVHREETARLDDPEHRRAISRVWLSLSGSYRFMDSNVLRGEQAKAVWDGRRVLFSPHLAVGNATLAFARELEAADPAHRKRRAGCFKELGKHWRTLATDQIDQQLRHVEVAAYASEINKTIAKVARGEAHDILQEAQRSHMDLFDDLFWHAVEQKHPDPQAAALAFIQSRLLEVPCVQIESILTERLAAEFSKSLPQPGNPERAKIDHTAYDIEAIAHFVPYCDAALLDNAMVDRLKQNQDQLPEAISSVKFFALRTLTELVDYLRALGTTPDETFTRIHWREEMLRTPLLPSLSSKGLAMAIFVPRDPDRLVGRTLLSIASDECGCELLPGGAVKLWQALPSDKPLLQDVVAIFKTFDNRLLYYSPEPCFNMVLYAQVFPKLNFAALIGCSEIPFGILDMRNPSLADLLQSWSASFDSGALSAVKSALS
jgi:hypothetical protein